MHSFHFFNKRVKVILLAMIESLVEGLRSLIHYLWVLRMMLVLCWSLMLLFSSNNPFLRRQHCIRIVHFATHHIIRPLRYGMLLLLSV